MRLLGHLLFLFLIQLAAAPQRSFAKTSPRVEAKPPASSTSVTTPAQAISATAEEYLAQATRAITEHRWGDAAECYLGFTRDFTRPETGKTIESFQAALALCLVRAQRFGEALLPLQRALQRVPAFPQDILVELHFQYATCEMTLRHFSQARAELQQTISVCPSGPRVQEACLLIAETHRHEGHPEKAAEHLAASHALFDGAHSSIATLLEIRSWLEADNPSQAWTLASNSIDSLNHSAAAIALQNTLLPLSQSLMENGLHREAILCLRQIRPTSAIKALVDSQLSWIKRQLKPDPSLTAGETAAALAGSQKLILSEWESMQRTENLDLWVQLQTANAYQSQERYHESALLLSDLLHHASPNPVSEQCGVVLLQNWLLLERWENAASDASYFRETYPNSPLLPLAIYCEGIARQRENNFAAAHAAFTRLIRGYPKTETASRARLMTGVTELMNGEPQTAARTLSDFIKQRPSTELAEDAAHWLCVSHAVSKQHELCRRAAAAYLEQYPDGAHRDAVLFQKARATFSLREYSNAVNELQSLLSTCPEHTRAGEARLLLADCFLTTDDFEPALAVLQSTPAWDPTSFDEAWFKAAKLLKRLGRNSEIVPHLARFEQTRPQSPRYAEAVLWTAKQLGDGPPSADAQHLVWSVIKEHSENPAIPAVEELLYRLPKLFTTATWEAEQTAAIQSWQASLDPQTHPVSDLRANWAIGSALRHSHAEASIAMLKSIAARIRPGQTSDRILSDVASAFDADNETQNALHVWSDLLKWNPRSIFKDRALSALVHAAASRGAPDKTLHLIHRLQKECPESRHLAAALLTKADLQEATAGTQDRRQTLEALLALRNASGEHKAEALLRLGAIEMQSGKPGAAIPYYQRVYVMYGRWREKVADAYLKSALAFEQINDPEAAKRTYEELLRMETPSDSPQKREAREQLERMQSIP